MKLPVHIYASLIFFFPVSFSDVDLILPFYLLILYHRFILDEGVNKKKKFVELIAVWIIPYNQI